MTNRAIATAVWLTIHTRLTSGDILRAGHGVEKIEARAHLKPGGLLEELRAWRERPEGYDCGFTTFWMFIAMNMIDPYTEMATGHNRQYWLNKF